MAKTINRIHRSIAKYPLLMLLAILSGSAVAEDDKYAPVRDTLQSCFVCHGENGASTQATFPILAGQEFYYLYVQLKDMKSGLRKSQIMGPLVKDIEKPQLRLMAEFFAEQEWPNTDFEATPEQITVGKKVVSSGQCVACHLGNFFGNSRVPRLANQHSAYLNQTMLDFKHKVRINAPPMNALFATFTEQQIKATAEYLAGFQDE